ALPILEVHLLEFDAPIYGKHLRVTFLEKLREQEKYDGLEALRAAIARDVNRTREYFRNHG
ncbi:MAG: bifunctional riboflavin kinase/FAD synthetase, partial [Betaproteobacteria bacterium]